MPQTGIIHDPRYLLHETGSFHPERSDRLRAIEKRLKEDHWLEKFQEIVPRKATSDEILLVHDRGHLEEVARTADTKGVYLDGDTFAGPNTYEISLLAAGGLLEATDQVVGGAVQNAFALVRPPGHHAERSYSMGFCIFNNVGIAAEYLAKKHHFKKIVVVDYDVHHGNATQHMFYDRPDVFYISTHRFPFYPGTGAASEKGTGAGAGYTLNIPMAAGEGDQEYQEVFERKVIPALREYRPDILLVSAGFDAHVRDPLGGMAVTEQGFHFMTKELVQVAQDYCQKKIIFTLEGGYDLEGLSKSVEEVFKVLTNTEC
jgi:acetoin utilization deacetylase AcuC-like enzyme